MFRRAVWKYFDTFIVKLKAMKNMTVVLLFMATMPGYSQLWKTDLKDAFKEASVSGKEVLLFFSVSETCPTCDKLEETVFQSTDFKNFASENYILVKQDFNSGKSDNLEENLLIVEKYNKDGFFPLVVVINKNTKVLGQIGVYNDESPTEYVAKLQSFRKS